MWVNAHACSGIRKRCKFLCVESACEGNERFDHFRVIGDEPANQVETTQKGSEFFKCRRCY